MRPNPPQPVLKVRTVFISDVHSGFKGCRAGYLLDFLRAAALACTWEAATQQFLGNLAPCVAT